MAVVHSFYFHSVLHKQDVSEHLTYSQQSNVHSQRIQSRYITIIKKHSKSV